MEDSEALHRSSFSRGPAGNAEIDWQDTCKAVEPGIIATIDRAHREGIDLILEGVHLEPNSAILRRWRSSGGIAIGIVMHIEDEEKHRNFLKQRESHSFRNAERYIAALPRLREIQQLMLHPGVIKVVGHMCAYGMKSTDEKGEGLVKKPTGWLTNSPYIAEQVSALCSNRWKGRLHRHVHLISGRAKAAEVYPLKLCKAISTGLRHQFLADG